MSRTGLYALLLLFVIGGTTGYYYLGHGKEKIRNVAGGMAVKGKIETAAQEAVKTPVRVEGLKLTLEAQEGTADHLTIDNPKGFAEAPAMKLGKVQFELDKDSLSGTGPLLVRMLAINEATISYEKNKTGSNLEDLAKTAGASAAAALQTKAGGSEKKAGDQRVMIDNVYIRNITVTAKGTAATSPKTATLRIVHLSNIGRAEGGVAPAKAAETIIAAVAQAADSAATQALASQ